MYDFETMDRRYIIFANIFISSNRLQVMMDKEMEEITAKQFFALIMLDAFEEPPTLKELAGISSTSHQNMKQIVLKLKEKGYVEIHSDARDKRAMRIYKTEKTKELDEKYSKQSQEFMDTAFSVLTKEEILKFSDYLARFNEHLTILKDDNNE